MITFPDYPAFSEVPDSDFQNVLTYLTSIPRCGACGARADACMFTGVCWLLCMCALESSCVCRDACTQALMHMCMQEYSCVYRCVQAGGYTTHVCMQEYLLVCALCRQACMCRCEVAGVYTGVHAGVWTGRFVYRCGWVCVYTCVHAGAWWRDMASEPHHRLGALALCSPHTAASSAWAQRWCPDAPLHGAGRPSPSVPSCGPQSHNVANLTISGRRALETSGPSMGRGCCVPVCGCASVIRTAKKLWCSKLGFQSSFPRSVPPPGGQSRHCREWAGPSVRSASHAGTMADRQTTCMQYIQRSVHTSVHSCSHVCACTITCATPGVAKAPPDMCT